MAIINDEPNRVAIAALELVERDTVLELGFGPGRGLAALSCRVLQGQVYGVDQSALMLAQASRRNRSAIESGQMNLLKGTFCPLPWKVAAFDKILLVNVVYFFGPAGHEMSEIHRVLRPGGRLVVYVTDSSTMKKWPFASPDTHLVFDQRDLRTLLERGGFDAPEVTIHTLHLPFGIRGLLAIAEKSFKPA
ncbi:class I SAM-dependent methyltransferase [Beijerinckia indica]|nr:class I SAM-dependent methyltransferase [Beijerinckia indica]